MKMMKMSDRTGPSKSKSEKFHCHPNSKSVGCVSGIFHFFARRHNSSRKRISSSSAGERRKDEPATEASKETVTIAQATSVFLRSLHLRRHYPREPPHSLGTAVGSPRRPATVVERLMGLDEFPVSSPDTSAGRRRKLLGAVESCEERVTSLKRIIGAARAAEERRRAVEEIVGTEAGADDCDSSVETVKSGSAEQPSPASVLDTISPSKFSFDKLDQDLTSKDGSTLAESKISSDVGVILSSEKCHNEINNPVARHTAKEGLPRVLKRSSEFKASFEDFAVAGGGGGTGPRLWRWARSRAMVETVCEVLERSSWEERKEAAKVAMALERGIFCDLVDELGAEFAVHCNAAAARRTCRKRLRF